MANTKLSDLTAASALAAADLVYAVQSAADKKATVQQIATAVTGSTTINGGTVTTSTPVVALTQTWNGATPLVFAAMTIDVTATFGTNAAYDSLLLDMKANGTTVWWLDVYGNMLAGAATFYSVNIQGNRASITDQGIIGTNSDGLIGFGNSTSSTAQDVGLSRTAAGVMRVCGASAAAGAGLELKEMTEPGTVAGDVGVLFMEDNGSGKTRLCVKFSSGTKIVLATQA